jgi:hypothetical protein
VFDSRVSFLFCCFGFQTYLRKKRRRRRKKKEERRKKKEKRKKDRSNYNKVECITIWVLSQQELSPHVIEIEDWGTYIYSSKPSAFKKEKRKKKKKKKIEEEEVNDMFVEQ